MIVNDFLAMVQVNSCWAMDPYNYYMMVVGDQGKAILFDARMGAQSRFQKTKTMQSFGSQVEEKRQMHHAKRVPVYSPEIDPATGEKRKWRIVKNFFTAHKFSRSEPHFVNAVKFSKQSRMFITSTNFGEVKLWDKMSCICLGTLNSHEYKPDQVMNYIGRSAAVSGHQELDDEEPPIDSAKNKRLKNINVMIQSRMSSAN